MTGFYTSISNFLVMLYKCFIKHVASIYIGNQPHLWSVSISGSVANYSFCGSQDHCQPKYIYPVKI